MGEIEILWKIGAIVIAAVVAVLGTRWANVPNIVAYLMAGLAIGPATGLIEVTETIELISEFGIALLLFLVGMELSIDKIKNVGPVALAAGIGQVVFTAAGGFGFAYLLDFTVIEAIFIAVALTFSSTVVVVKLLDQKKEIDALYGRIAVGIFLVQDIVVVIALTFVAGLGEGEAMAFGEMAASVGLAFAGMAVLLAVALLAARYALPVAFDWVERSPDTMFVWSLFWCFLFVVGAEAMNLSKEIGAFLAGIAIAQLPHSHDLIRRVHPLVNFFIAVFFVSLGLQMELGAAAEHWVAAIVLSLFVLIGNPLIFMIIITRMGYGERTSFLTSVTVAQISEFSFIFATMGFGAGLIDQSILSLIALIGIVTIGTSAYMILYNRELYEVLRRWGLLRVFRSPPEERERDPDALRDHVIVVGMNTLGRRLAGELCRRGETVLAIDYDPEKLEGLPCEGLHGDVSQPLVLSEAKLDDAKLLVSALNIEGTNNLLAFRAKQAGVPCSIHAFDDEVRDDLKALDVDHLLESKREGVTDLIAALDEKMGSS